MHVTNEPLALVTCGSDRRVRTWSIDNLDLYGTLLQSRDKAFRFPYDPSSAHARKMSEACALIDKLGPVERTTKLPALMPRSGKDATLLDLIASGRRRKEHKRDQDSIWKLSVEQVINDEEADKIDYTILFEQMERLGHGEPIDVPQEKAEERLLRHA